MTSLRFIFATLLASTLLTSCGSFEHFDSKYPTVSQQDAYDVSWGLPPRKVRGNPKMRYQYNARAEQQQSAAPMSLEPAAPAAAPSLPPAAAPSRAPSSPTIPSNLR
ncbi:hypothetical protein [Prosthecobacter sp.]|uniref:hypothetical protein n=1 Tax=Prosthecobacter sp. TaxID=1965333 RepID=UPI003783B126